MTNIIRSARLASELKTVPIPGLQAEVRKIPVQVQPRAYGQGQSAAEQAPSQAPPQAPPAAAPPVAAPVMPTYEEYKQRLGLELDVLRQQAIASGKEEGLKLAWQTAEEHYRRQLETLRALMESVRDARQRYVEDIGDEAVEIVFVAVSRILGAGFATREVAVAAVQEAIRSCKERGRMLVKVAPEDFKVLNAQRRELLEVGSASEVELVADEQVKWGGCLLEGTSGNLDARLETQLQRLRDTLLNARAQWNGPGEASPDE
jgi:flagellar assembly protein FliH